MNTRNCYRLAWDRIQSWAVCAHAQSSCRY